MLHSFRHTSIGRRVILLFLICAVLPTASIAFLTLHHVASSLVEKQTSDLAYKAKGFGLLLVDRLVNVRLILEHTSNYLGVSDQGQVSRLVVSPSVERMISALAMIDNAGSVNTLYGRPGELDHAAALVIGEKPHVVTHQSAAGGADVDMVYPLPGGGVARALVARVQVGYLWGDPDSYPYRTQFCVTGGSGLLLYCSIPVSELAATVSAVRDLFLRSHFESPDWRIMASQPREVATESVQALWRLVPGVGVLLLLGVSLLTLMHIRRTLGPLGALTAGTRRIAEQDFQTRIQVDTHDELAELAAGFNTMAERLGGQFATMRALSQIDSAILEHEQTEPVVELLLEAVLQVTGGSFAAITLLDRDAPCMAKTIWRHADSSTVQSRRAELRDRELHALSSVPAGSEISPGTDLYGALTAGEAGAAGELFFAPVQLGGKPRAVLMVPSPQQRAGGDGVRNVLSFTQRLAVAVAAIDRREDLLRKAQYDSLTDLPNRQYLDTFLTRELVRAKACGHHVAVLFLDCDRFKLVNDTLGHTAGDELLKVVATRLRGVIGATDIVARMGGDEFVVVLSELSASRVAAGVARRLVQAFEEPISLRESSYHMSASVGISMFPEDGAEAEQLMGQADTAMYRAKGAGGNRFVFFEKAMDRELQRRSTLERDLRQALTRDELTLWYQPQLQVSTETIVSAEALVRWNHPQRGMLLPGEFIDVAEESGLIVDMGYWIIERAITDVMQLSTWGIELQRIGVNVSPRQLHGDEFLAELKRLLVSYDIAPQTLEVEITESLLLDDVDHARELLARIRGTGVRLALDDFGTGYSSLTYVHQLPFDTVKIDRSFIKHVDRAAESAAIVEATLHMARGLGMEVVAEGVERLEELDFLSRRGCDLIQGYWLSRPVPLSELAQFVRTWNTDAAVQNHG